jgi:DNA polymerase (family 10)
VPGVGPKTEAQLLDALAREGEPRPQRRLLLNRARELVEGIAVALDGEAAGDVRRWRDSCERLSVVCAAADPGPVLARFTALHQVVALIEQDERRAVGVTVEGVPVELVAAEPERFGTALVRATGSPAYVAALEPLPDAPDERAVYRALDLPWCPPELREEPFRGAPPALVEPADIRGDLHCHSTWSDGRASIDEMARAAGERGYEYLAICDHTPAVGAVPGLTADGLRRQGEEVAEVNGLPDRLDLSGEHVREALRAGVPIVCSTDAHSVRGLGNMTLSVATARRGWATRADVLNTQPLESMLEGRSGRSGAARRSRPR